MDPEGGVEISAETTADVGQSWTPANASVIIVSLQGNRQYFKLGVLRDFCVIKLSHVRKEVVNSCSLLLNVQTYVSCTFNINGIVVSL